jgi:protein TonB
MAIRDSNARKNPTETEEALFINCGPDASVNPEEWIAYLNNNLVLDDTLLDTIPANKYIVVVQFMIDTKGRICDVEIRKDPGYGLGKKVMDVVSQFKGHWQPAASNGRAIKSYHMQPVTFIVEEAEKECEEPMPADYLL